MKLTGCSNLSIDHEDGAGSVTLTLHFKTPLQAREAFARLERQSDHGEIDLKLTLGGRISEH